MFLTMEVLIGISVLLSAGTYLFDFVSNILVAVRYGQHYFELLGLEKKGICSDRCRKQTSELAGYFWAIIGILFCSHTLNALIFKFRVHKKDSPFRAAYFLPLMHLWRLLYLVWNTLSCKGIGALRSAELNGLFGILGTSFEGMPILVLQFGAYIVLVKGNDIFHEMFLIFKISVAASLLSAAYTGGAAVESIATNAKSLWEKLNVAISAGLFTMFASVSRGLTYINIIIHMRDYFQRNRSTRSKAKYHLTDSIPILFLTFTIASYWLFYWLFQFPKLMQQRLHSWKRCLVSLLFGYMSIITGPLYPMVNEARQMNDQLGSCRFRTRLLFVVIINVCVDVAVTGITFWMRTLSKPYVLTSILSVLGCLLCIFWYSWTDACCGPAMTKEDNLEAHSVVIAVKQHKASSLDVCFQDSIVNVEDFVCDSFHTAHDSIEDEIKDINLIYGDAYDDDDPSLSSWSNQ